MKKYILLTDGQILEMTRDSSFSGVRHYGVITQSTNPEHSCGWIPVFLVEREISQEEKDEIDTKSLAATSEKHRELAKTLKFLLSATESMPEVAVSALAYQMSLEEVGRFVEKQ